MRRLLSIISISTIAIVATPALAQTSFGSTNCYVAGANVSCQEQSQTTEQPSQPPVYQQMMQQQQNTNDWQAVAGLAVGDRLARDCRKAVRAGDTNWVEAHCR